MRQPDHACALLTDPHGRLVLQLRPPWLRHAPDQLTCFGGKREAEESAVDCLRRELREETGWAPVQIPPDGVDLIDGPQWIARFFPLRLPAGVSVRTEPGFVVIRADPRTLPGLPVSSWHRLALAAWQGGAVCVDLGKSG